MKYCCSCCVRSKRKWSLVSGKAVVVERIAWTRIQTQKERKLWIEIALYPFPCDYHLRSCHTLSVRACANFVFVLPLSRNILVFCLFTHFSQIVHEMKRLVGLNESLARVFSLGKTYENRTMYGIRVSNIITDLHVHIFTVCGRH